VSEEKGANMDTLGSYGFKVRGYECGPDGLATFATLCNYLQEAAGLHAGELGFSKQDFNAAGTDVSWILTRMRVRMSRYPAWWDEVEVRTFPWGGRKVVTYRDFELRVGGEVIGIASSEWMILDLATRRLVPIPANVYAAGNDERQPVFGGAEFSKLRWDCRETASADRFRVRRGDIDINRHVNNVRYIEWIVEALPPSAAPIAEFEIAFKSETLAGDEVLTESVEVEPGVFVARAAAADGRDHAVARVVTGR